MKETTQGASAIAALVSSKMSETQTTTKTETVRFMLEITPACRELISTLATITKSKQIALASQIFELAMKEAAKTVKAAEAKKAEVVVK